ncbi:transcriptional regulator, Nlp family [Aliiroseovarius halocynthiae]|uniref:Transcriptional regulator n=1 Tax=Aliiroseovarius halocynthiae TaxID=985055 RepID=A0A545SW75_9RHOB|nr:helix-turn-helix domain-containing protein [Aliiroseovarius halocynthiae]TQV69215.1 transcriptional regulator [Aliiroseovarius halocynthiae]SMR71982.1 transcriptional regulator, Nlp family [Aliiroseovarius halocynthiae]
MTNAYSKLKADLKSAGVTLRSIARDVGVSHTAVTDVARGARRSKRIEQAIADSLNTTPELLWSDRYGQEGGAT